MRKLSIHHLQPNMVAADNVLDFNRRLILEKGTVLTDVLIDRLLSNQIISIYVEDDFPDPAPAQATVPLPDLSMSYSERVRQSPEFKAFKKKYDAQVTEFQGVLNDIVQKNTHTDVTSMIQGYLELISSAGSKISVLDMLQNMRSYADATYAHSMNVALICNVLATWLHLSEKEIELATTCGLFHDIGKIRVPSEVIQKPSSLTKEEFLKVRAHPVEGYKILKDMNMSSHVQNAALMHHERMDGTGYPLGLKREKIDRYAALVSIADVYDAMTSKRVYRDALCPFACIELFEDEGFDRYETEFLIPFLENVVNTYLQHRCVLSDGRIGTIVFINHEKMSRPIVECDGKFINLAKHPELKIERII